MKKQNNRFRNGNNNNGYTLNYKFDSVSIAGKISGTALDLIRRYNDLAKEAQSSGDYVEMEIYRQYAEHYRKIVTDINERRQSRQENNFKNNNQETDNSTEEQSENIEVSQETTESVVNENGYVETLPSNGEVKVKSFEVVEISENNVEEEAIKDTPKPKRVYRRRVSTQKSAEA